MESVKNEKSKSGFFSNFLKKTDRFGLTFSLCHNDGFEYHTVLGGMFSIILYFIVAYTIVNLMIRMAHHQSVTVDVTNTDNQFIFSNETVKPFENDKFMIAISANLNGIPTNSWFGNNIVYIFRKITAEYDPQTQKFKDTIEHYNLSYWDETDFPKYVFDTFSRVQYALWLPKDVELKGGVFTDSQTQFSLLMYYIPNSYWGTYEEFKEQVPEISFYFLVAHEEFDSTNFEDPITAVIDDQYFISIDPSVQTYYYFMIQK